MRLPEIEITVPVGVPELCQTTIGLQEEIQPTGALEPEVMATEAAQPQIGILVIEELPQEVPGATVLQQERHLEQIATVGLQAKVLAIGAQGQDLQAEVQDTEVLGQDLQAEVLAIAVLVEAQEVPEALEVPVVQADLLEEDLLVGAAADDDTKSRYILQ